MPAVYLRDLSIREPGQWTGRECLDWLHPCHGPLPDKVGIVRLDGYDYCVALWTTSDCIITMTEIIDLSRVRDNWDHLAKKNGWIVNSLCWRASPYGFECAGTTISVHVERLKPGEQERDWNWKYFKQIMMKSVEITASTPIGYQIYRASDYLLVAKQGSPE